MTQPGLQIGIEVIYAEPDRAIARAFRLPAPANVGDALQLAAATPEFAGMDLVSCAVGVFGLLATRGQPLADGDRIEIYRPLAADPKQARRTRARAQR